VKRFQPTLNIERLDVFRDFVPESRCQVGSHDRFDVAGLPDGQYTRVAGCVIARQRPGTAKGFVFLSLEDETGISNIIVNPDLYESYRRVINSNKFLRVEGVLQNQDHVISVKASRVMPISITAVETESHDFH